MSMQYHIGPRSGANIGLGLKSSKEEMRERGHVQQDLEQAWAKVNSLGSTYKVQDSQSFTSLIPPG
jgi:hypothetical protein